MKLSDAELDAAMFMRDLRRGYGVNDDLQLFNRMLTLARIVLQHSKDGKAVLLHEGRQINVILNDPPRDDL